MSQTIVILFCHTYPYFDHSCFICSFMHTIPPWQTQNMVQHNLALLQPQRNDEHGLSLSHWHLLNLRMSTGAGQTWGELL